MNIYSISPINFRASLTRPLLASHAQKTSWRPFVCHHIRHRQVGRLHFRHQVLVARSQLPNAALQRNATWNFFAANTDKFVAQLKGTLFASGAKETLLFEHICV